MQHNEIRLAAKRRSYALIGRLTKKCKVKKGFLAFGTLAEGAERRGSNNGRKFFKDLHCK